MTSAPESTSSIVTAMFKPLIVMVSLHYGLIRSVSNQRRHRLTATLTTQWENWRQSQKVTTTKRMDMTFPLTTTRYC
ncbi:hypothetical protein O9929_20875 [Vibrio lentus]|nr:hypothetical protein [Vibrio lentus]